MPDSLFRISCHGADERLHIRQIVQFFTRELHFDESRILQALDSPPRVLWSECSATEAELIQTAMKRLGCRVETELLANEPSLPFPLTSSTFSSLHKELSKVLRARASLAFALILVEPTPRQPNPPSLLGPVLAELQAKFRESDSLVALDDQHAVLLGFGCGFESIKHLEEKIPRVFHGLLGDDCTVRAGFSVFPDESRSLSALLQLSETRSQTPQAAPQPITDAKPAHALKSGPAAAPQPQAAAAVTAGTSGESDPLTETLGQARGRIYQRILDLPVETLARSLQRLPLETRRHFLDRVPTNHPGAAVLQPLYHAPEMPSSEAHRSDENMLEAILLQMVPGQQREPQALKRSAIETKLAQVETLSTLPAIASQILTIAADPQSTAETLTGLIREDPSMTGKLLRMVNSAFYGFPQKISTIEHAVSILGLEEITSLACSVSVAGIFRKPLHVACVQPVQLWEHAAGTAFVCQALAIHYHIPEQAMLFTAGLLHDCGRQFLLEHLPQRSAELFQEWSRRQDALFCELEDDEFGISHACIGGTLCKQWNLPESLCRIVEFHHIPAQAPADGELAALVGLADAITHDVLNRNRTSGLPTSALTLGQMEFMQQVLPDFNHGQLDLLTKIAIHALDKNRRKLVLPDSI